MHWSVLNINLVVVSKKTASEETPKVDFPSFSPLRKYYKYHPRITRTSTSSLIFKIDMRLRLQKANKARKSKQFLQGCGSR